MLWLRNVAAEATVKKQELLSWIVIRLSLPMPMLWHCLLDYCFQDEKCLVQAVIYCSLIWQKLGQKQWCNKDSWFLETKAKNFPQRKRAPPEISWRGSLVPLACCAWGQLPPLLPLVMPLHRNSKSECIQLLYMLSYIRQKLSEQKMSKEQKKLTA